MKEKINELEMSEELKEQITKILLETSDEEEIIEEIEEKSETSEDVEYEEIECEEENCIENCIENCSCRYTINTISKELKRTLEMIDSIEDPEEKFKWLSIVKNDLLKEETRIEAPPLEKFVGYDFNKILKMQKRKKER